MAVNPSTGTGPITETDSMVQGIYAEGEILILEIGQALQIEVRIELEAKVHLSVEIIAPTIIPE